MRSSSFSAEQTTRIASAFLREPIPARAKVLAAVIASFSAIPGWVIRKPHIRSVCEAAGFDAAWSALLRCGVLTLDRRRNVQGRYEYIYHLDRNRVCGQTPFALVPNELLRSALSMNAKWLYTVCADWMTLPDFIFDRARLRNRAGFGHYRFYAAYTELRDTGWLLVERVPGQKCRRYSLTRGDRSILASTSLQFRAARLAEQKTAEAGSVSPDEQRLLTQAHFRRLLPPSPGLNDTVAQTAVRLIADVMSGSRTHYRLGGRRISGQDLRSRLAALSDKQLQRAIRQVQRIPNIRNLPGYLLTVLYRAADELPPNPTSGEKSDASYDLAAFERMCLYEPLGQPF